MSSSTNASSSTTSGIAALWKSHPATASTSTSTSAADISHEGGTGEGGEDCGALFARLQAALEREHRRLDEKRAAAERCAGRAAVDGEEVVTLDVGGRRHVTCKSTLLSVPNTMLATMFSGRFAPCRRDDGSYFIDRDGDLFCFILEYLRNKKIALPEDPAIRAKILEEADFYCLPDLGRLSMIGSTGTELRYTSDFDENGLLYWIGTKGKTGTWHNPHGLGEVEVTRSSGDGADCCGLVPNFVGRTPAHLHTQNNSRTPGEWFMVDFKEHCFCYPTHYTIRAYGPNGDGSHPRNWQLQASTDGRAWMILDQQVDCTALSHFGETHTWPIAPMAGTDPAKTKEKPLMFQYLRVVNIGPNARGLMVLCLSGIEVYATVHPTAHPKKLS
ncbi:K+ channel tetramerization subfamily protein [Pelomyxa schiedti]|nr:K+ channel tetramerization subfamily protein [Pelomyxa schiedti]